MCSKILKYAIFEGVLFKRFHSQRVKMDIIICTTYYIIQINGDLKFVLKEMYIGWNNFEKNVLRGLIMIETKSFFFLLCQL